MVKRGPRPTPTRILELRGSQRAKSRGIEPQPERTTPDCPDWLDDGAKSCWAQIVPQLEQMGVLTRIDANALTRYCVLWTQWIGAQKFLMQYGTTYPLKDKNGNLKCMMPWPQVSQVRGWGEQLRRLEAEFGMTPASRVGLDTSCVSTPQNNLAEFLKAKPS
jgi:P27 family predicted phage terminase small subunit